MNAVIMALVATIGLMSGATDATLESSTPWCCATKQECCKSVQPCCHWQVTRTELRSTPWCCATRQECCKSGGPCCRIGSTELDNMVLASATDHPAFAAREGN
jgi:hypothetical protein